MHPKPTSFLQILRRNKQILRHLCSSICIPTSLTSQNLNLPLVSELLAKQQWSELRTHLKDSNFAAVLHQLLDSGADPVLILRYLNCSQMDFNDIHTLELTFRLLRSLAVAKRYSKIRAFLHGFVRNNEKLSNSSIIHSLSLGRNQFAANSSISNMLVLAYANNSKTRLGVEAFQKAGDYGFKLLVFSCNPLLRALVKESEIGKLEFVYKEMIRRRIEPNLYTFNMVIRGLCKAGKLEKAKDVIISDMKAWGISPNVVTYNALIDGYCKLGKMYKADAIVKDMVANSIPPNKCSYNILISGFGKVENIPAAVKVFETMAKQDLKPNVFTCSSLINGLCCIGELDKACDLLDEMRGLGLKPMLLPTMHL